MTEVRLNEHNTNKGTPRGRYMVETSLEQVGPRRSAVADKDGVIIAGNKTVAAALAAGIELEVVKGNPDKLTVLQFDDLDIDGEGEAGEKARLYEMIDNRAAQVGLEWDVDEVHRRHGEGLDLLLMFSEAEMANTFDIELRETNDDILNLLATPERQINDDGEGDGENDDGEPDQVQSSQPGVPLVKQSQESGPLVPRYPVPIVLDRDQRAKWEEFKAHNCIRNDLKAFLYLLDLYSEPLEE